jgi:hypothetical protein
MFHYERELPSFGGISAGNTHVSLAPRGPSYRGIVLECFKNTTAILTTAEMASQLSAIKVKINGVARYEMDADTLQDINAYYGYAAVNGYLPMFFTYHWLRTVPALENLVWGTQNVDSLALEVTLASGATCNAMKAYGIITPEKRDLGLIIEQHTYTYAPGGAGQFEISDLPKRNGALFALHIDSSVCSRADIKLEGVDLRAVPDAVSSNWQTWQGKRTAQANYRHYDPAAYAFLADDRVPLQNASDFRVLCTTTGAGTLKAHMMTINQPLAPLA